MPIDPLTTLVNNHHATIRRERAIMGAFNRAMATRMAARWNRLFPLPCPGAAYVPAPIHGDPARGWHVVELDLAP